MDHARFITAVTRSSITAWQSDFDNTRRTLASCQSTIRASQRPVAGNLNAVKATQLGKQIRVRTVVVRKKSIQACRSPKLHPRRRTARFSVVKA